MTGRLRSVLPESVKNFLRPFYHQHQETFYRMSLPYYRFLDRFRLNDLNSIYNEEYFTKRTSHPWSTTTEEVVAELVERFEPESVVDLGCAIGVYIREFEDNGVPGVGIEGAEKAVRNAVLDDVFHADLRDPLSNPPTADLVLCIEVAEHLHPEYADQLVENISKCVEASGTAIVSAAPPGQLGTHHINLQPKEYWIKKFKSEGLSFDRSETKNLVDAIKVRLSKRDIDWEATENLMVFRKGSSD